MERDVIQRMISEYKKRIETYQAMIAEWEKELGLAPGAVLTGDSEQPSGKAKSSTGDIPSLVRNFQFFGRTQTEAAKALLELVGHPLTTEEIMEGVVKGGLKLGGKTPKDKKQNFYTILNRSKEFGRAAKNTWGISSWPGITKDEDEGADDSKEAKKEKPSQE
ncbi:MAG TPA: HTH domain-containing protein [Terriglobales bacterium]|jgi:hypothetical protein|nr:HTH domain-containing protein [Terriglobales bacterium]